MNVVGVPGALRISFNRDKLYERSLERSVGHTAGLHDTGELIRVLTLSRADIAFVWQHRGDHNRFGIAVLMAYLRYPGRTPAKDEKPHGCVCRQVRPLPEQSWHISNACAPYLNCRFHPKRADGCIRIGSCSLHVKLARQPSITSGTTSRIGVTERWSL